MSKRKLVYTRRVDGVQVYEDLPLKCLGCGETYFLTSKTCSRWRAEQLAKSSGYSAERYCKPCNEKFKRENAAELEKLRRQHAINSARSDKKRKDWKESRKKNIQVRCVCDHCGKEDVSEFVFHTDIKQPKGWKNHPSTTLRPGDLLCPDCNSTRHARVEKEREAYEDSDVKIIRGKLWRHRNKLEEWAKRENKK